MEKNGKNTANGEENKWKVKMCYQDFARTFPTKQAGSACGSALRDKEAVLRQLSLAKQRLDRHPLPAGKVYIPDYEHCFGRQTVILLLRKMVAC